jgi:hypothetical protein
MEAEQQAVPVTQLTVPELEAALRMAFAHAQPVARPRKRAVRK